MAIPIEGYSVVVKKHKINNYLEEGIVEAPNARSLFDNDLWSCSFMAKSDAQVFMKDLEAIGLNTTQGPESDAVIVTEFDQSIFPYCEWLNTGQWEKAIIAWKEGTEPKSVMAYENWDPKKGSGLTFHDPGSMDNLEFLRLENNIEVFLDKNTGKEVYIGRSSPPYESMFKSAKEIIWKHSITTGQQAVKGQAKEEVQNAVEMLEQILNELEPSEDIYFFLAKGKASLGDWEDAYQLLMKGYEINDNNEAIIRELGGICLEIKKFKESIKVNEKALGFAPDNIELLGNLALSYLMDGRIEEATKAIDRAIDLDKDDKINNLLNRVIKEVKSGKRPFPERVSDLTKKASSFQSNKKNPAKKKRFWEFWK